jgi:excinuclease ABC subunit C
MMDDVTTADLVEQFLTQEYLPGRVPEAGRRATGAPASPASASAPTATNGSTAGSDSTAANEIPREVLVPVLPPDAEAVAELLSMVRGTRVDLRVPQRGDKRTLFETVERNAKQALALHRTKRASDLTARSRALAELQEALDLPDAPLRIECFDVSNTQGSDVVASMIVFEDGLPRKAEYRRFSIRGVAGQDDVASMHETISRRFTRYLAERSRAGDAGEPAAHDSAPPQEDIQAQEQEEDAPPQENQGKQAAQPVDPETGRPRRFAYPPNLVVVDGGPPQVAAARRALDELGIDDGPGGVALCGLAKRLEEVWLPDLDEPVILPRTSEALYLLQRVRDEAHRFAITYHRQKRSKSMVVSALDDVPGLGETRRKALLRRFGSLARLREASAEQIAEVPGIGAKTAAAVVASLARTAPGGSAAPPPAVDPATGEILEGKPGGSSAGTRPEPGGTNPEPAIEPAPTPPATSTRGMHT